MKQFLERRYSWSRIISNFGYDVSCYVSLKLIWRNFGRYNEFECSSKSCSLFWENVVLERLSTRLLNSMFTAARFLDIQFCLPFSRWDFRFLFSLGSFDSRLHAVFHLWIGYPVRGRTGLSWVASERGRRVVCEDLSDCAIFSSPCSTISL